MNKETLFYKFCLCIVLLITTSIAFMVGAIERRKEGERNLLRDQICVNSGETYINCYRLIYGP
jgi:hypothetical protein